MNSWRILQGDVRETLATIPAGSVQCCVTSPPYWGLRSYLDATDPDKPLELGTEPAPAEYVRNMVDVFACVWRVLKDDGTLWLNLGDSYSGAGHSNHDGTNGAQREDGGKQRHSHHHGVGGLKPKDLVGIPWMVAFALRDAGWYLRSDIIWAKSNPMPESVTDRPTKAHEYLFLLTKSARYYYDAAAIREENSNPGLTEAAVDWRDRPNNGVWPKGTGGRMGSVKDGRNKRTVWTVATQPYAEAHFATFPEALIEPCILAGSRQGDTVLDPFNGSGTTGAVSVRHQRDYIGCELNPAYIELARKRINAVAPMFAQEVA